MRILIYTIFIIFVSGCSTKTPSNNWQYQSKNSYKNFERYYLEDQTDLAAIEFSHARSYATQSADLTILARIELSRCALKVAILEPFSCKEYDDLRLITHDNELEAYYALLSKNTQQITISNLPSQYHSFALSLIQNDSENINTYISNIVPLTSRMIAASIVVNSLNEATINKIIADASYLGYKHAVIKWLNLLIERTSDQDKRKILIKKLNILTTIK